MLTREEFRNSVEDTDIIDVHTHVGAEHGHFLHRKYPTVQSVHDLVHKMDVAGVDYAVTFPCAGSYYYYNLAAFQRNYELIPSRESPEKFPYQLANESMLYEIEALGNNQLLPFAIINPRVEEESQYGFLHDLAKQGILFGLKIHTLSTHKSVMDLHQSKLKQLLQDFDLPLMTHSGPDEYSDPMKTLQFAELNPNIKVCIAHAARCQSRVYERLSEGDLGNVFLDTSPWIRLCHYVESVRDVAGAISRLDFPYTKDPTVSLVSLYRHYPTGILWGTDEPYNTFVETKDGKPIVIAHVDYTDEVELLSSLPSDIAKEIANRNTLRYLLGTT